MRRRDAPSDSRMPISRWRERPRASSRLATLAQPIIKISPKAKNSGAKHHAEPIARQRTLARGQRPDGTPGGRLPASAKGFGGLAEARPAREGNKSARPVAHAETAAAAASGASPGFSRPMTSIGTRSRPRGVAELRGQREWRPVSGGVTPSPRKPSGMTPTISNGARPIITRRPITPRSPRNSLCQPA